MTDKPLARNRLLMVLITVSVLTVTGLLVLSAIPKSTIVELTVVVKRFSLTLMPPRPPDTSIILLNRNLKIRSMQSEGLDKIEADIASAAVREFKLDPETKVDLRSNRPFKPVIKLFASARLTLETYRRDQIILGLQLKGPGDSHWQSWAEAPEQVQIRFDEPGAADHSAASGLPVAEWIPVNKGTKVFMTGGTAASKFGLRLAGVAAKNDAVLKVIDIQTGRITSKQNVPLKLHQNPTIIPQADRLIVLEKNVGAKNGAPVFSSNINVRNPQFFLLTGQKEESFVTGGTLRFPAGERTEVTLEKDTYISVSGDSAFKLKSMALENGRLKVVLWGRPSSLKVGPTTGILTQYLPSHLLWAYTHKSSVLMFTILGWILGSCITFMKLFGFVGK